MSTIAPPYDTEVIRERDAHRLLGQVMGFVAVTVGFTALGAYVGRDLSGATGIVAFGGSFAAIIGLNVAVARGREQLTISFLFGLGFLLGLAVAPVISDYADADPAALWQAAGVTAALAAATGAYGYATSRDLSSWARPLSWALLALIVFGIAAIFVSIPGANVIYAVAGPAVFGGFTIVDFNRMRSSSSNDAATALTTASIFLDIFNVFLLFLDLLGPGATDHT
jgi:modulator of FtsH protease